MKSNESINLTQNRTQKMSVQQFIDTINWSIVA